MNRLEFIEVHKRFGSVAALAGASFTLEEGEVLALIGPNGSGKTTAIRLALGLLAADRGSVRAFGLDPARTMRTLGPRLGVVGEHSGIEPFLTAREQLELYSALHGHTGAAVRRRTDALLWRLGLTARADVPARTLSKGQQQRLALARCLTGRAELLVMDEPFDGVDVESRRTVLELLASIVRECGTSVLVTSHDLAEVERTADRVAVIDRGRIVACEPVRALLAGERRSLEDAYFALTAGEDR